MNQSSANRDDQRLIQLTLDGQQEAFGHLIRKYQDRLYNGMVHILRDQSEAEDVVQDAFILAMTRLDSFKGNSQFFTWLYRIAYNVAITRLRRKKPTVSIQGSENTLRLTLPDEGPTPDARMSRQESVSQLMLAMERLSEEHRSILVLREMEELEYEAISEILDLPVGTVRSRLHRARSQLKQMLELIMGEVDN
jgi:RNA polymerase sigma-70 factor (ECF subfamily)